MFKVLDTLKIVQNNKSADLTLAATWAGAGVLDLGDIKGKPFVKVTFDVDLSSDTQAGTKQYSSKSHMETSTLKLDSVTAAALDAMIGQNVSLLATPAGAVSATNPIVIVKNFLLESAGEKNIGDVSYRKLSGDKPVYAEADAYVELTAALGE
jgi:hypothetical protein